MVRRETLLIIAGLLWLFAGTKVFLLGLSLYGPYEDGINLLFSAEIFALFLAFAFRPVVRKHRARIKALEEKRQPIFYFFDRKSYIMMVMMMAIGFVVRAFGILPLKFIAVFYSGLGAALVAAGVAFFASYISLKEEDKEHKKKS